MQKVCLGIALGTSTYGRQVKGAGFSRRRYWTARQCQEETTAKLSGNSGSEIAPQNCPKLGLKKAGLSILE